MGWGERLRAVFGARPVTFDDRAPVRFHDDPGIGALVDSLLQGMGRVDRAQALGVPVVLKGRNLICGISTLPLQSVDDSNRTVDNPLLSQIDPNVPNVVTVAMLAEDLLFEAVAWLRITTFDVDGYPASAIRYEPGQVTLNPPTGYEHALLPSGLPAHGVVWMAGHPVPWSQVIRFDSPNPALLVVGQRPIKRAIALDKAADLYAGSPRMRGFFTPKEGVDPADDDEIIAALDQWAVARKKRVDGYVPAALDYNAIQDPTPAELQLIQMQQRADLAIAVALGVDPEDVGVSTTSRTYANLVDRRKDRINDTLSPYMRAITDRLSMPDVTRPGESVRFWLDDYLRADPKTRAEVQQIYHALGVTDAQEIREEEGKPPRAITPPAAAPEDAAALAPRRVPSTTGTPMQIAAAAAAAHTFAREPVHFDYEPAAAFAVDPMARTITGLVVPWNKVSGVNKGRRYRFARGALKWNNASRVKLLRDHVNSSAIGRALSFEVTDQGLVGTFKVSPGPEGDAALALAADQVLDGLSPGVDFQPERDLVPDPVHRGAWLILSSALREVSLTAVPSFDDSRLTSVRASDGGTMDTCATCGATLTEGVAHTCNPTPATTPPPAAAAVSFSGEQFTQILQAVSGQHAAAATPPAAAGAAAVRPVVDPTSRTTAATFVSEPAPYRFDRQGNLHAATHDFGADVIAGLRDRNAEAYDRAMNFMRAQFDATFDVITTNVNELNPTQNRPEMYVDQRSYQYPLWSAINKGTLTSITPFTFPKFSSASGLVAAHTEGVEPTSGSFVTTLDTVTPSAVSGKVKLSRETWDQGGNPQIGNLLWRQMTKGWFEALEAAAVAVLDAASPTQIDFSGSPGLANDDLDQALTAALASLQFIRGGFSMDTAFTQIDLFKALVAATGADGRRLYPALGPSNANGTVRGRWSGIDVNGLAFLPAWALAATGTVSASSYLFDREVVHGWASAPQRLDIDRVEVANVYIGIWGYKATVISDLTGVREIVYDPS